MKRLVVAFALWVAFLAGLLLILSASMPARAQDAPSPDGRCYPGISCPGEVIGMPAWRRGDVGWHAWVFYLRADGSPASEAWMCTHEGGGCVGQESAIATAARTCAVSLFEADRLECAKQAFRERVTWACTPALAQGTDVRARLCAESIAIRTADAAARGIDWPPRPWVVDAATSADGTRPAYAAANGVRASRSTARAQAGQPCKPSVASIASDSAGKVWAAFGPAFDPGFVALCKRGD